MEHLAILKEPFLSRILSGKKTLESRWTRTRRAPFNRIQAGETVFLKRSGGPVVARATVADVEQHADLTEERVAMLIEEHREALGVERTDRLLAQARKARYCVLITLRDVEAVEPFTIDKTGYGNITAWLCVEDVDSLRC